MFFLNLTASEFLGLLGVLGGAITALYFLDRSKRRKVVSTLQFWVSAATASEQRSRKKMNQPWSLLLQLLSLLLLLLAIAQLQWGTRAAAGRDHVLLLDTSSWSDARTPAGTALAREIQQATQYLSALPRQDRVLIAQADALITPTTMFTSDREQWHSALTQAKSSSTVLNLSAALAYSTQAQRGSGGLPGEIVYVGPQRIATGASPIVNPPNLRVLAVPVEGNNRGIRGIQTRRAGADQNSWLARVTLLNYDTRTRQVQLRTQFAGTRFAPRAYSLPPHQEVTADYTFVTNTSGVFTAQIADSDVLSQDNQASLQLPGLRGFAVTVYTKRAELIRPLLNADPRIVATYLDPSQATGKATGDLTIFDRCTTLTPPAGAAIWINPPADHSPLPVQSVVTKALIQRWNSDLPMAVGLHARDERIPQASIYTTQAGDMTLATIGGPGGEGPSIVLRSAMRSDGERGSKLAVIGFDPLEPNMRYTVTTPLLFANLLEWMAPEAVRTTELEATRVGPAKVTLDPGERAGDLRVETAEGAPLPFTLHEQTLQLFTNKPTIAKVKSGQREIVLSATLPDVGDERWVPSPAAVASGVPSFASFSGASVDLWQWLACAGALGLLVEWLLFGRTRGRILPFSNSARHRVTKEKEELVNQ